MTNQRKKSLGCPVPVHLRHIQTHRRVQVRRPALLARDSRGRNEKGTKKSLVLVRLDALVLVRLDILVVIRRQTCNGNSTRAEWRKFKRRAAYWLRTSGAMAGHGQRKPFVRSH